MMPIALNTLDTAIWKLGKVNSLPKIMSFGRVF